MKWKDAHLAAKQYNFVVETVYVTVAFVGEKENVHVDMVVVIHLLVNHMVVKKSS